jgi:hypothetical protein
MVNRAEGWLEETADDPDNCWEQGWVLKKSDFLNKDEN